MFHLIFLIPVLVVLLLGILLLAVLCSQRMQEECHDHLELPRRAPDL